MTTIGTSLRGILDKIEVELNSVNTELKNEDCFLLRGKRLGLLKAEQIVQSEILNQNRIERENNDELYMFLKSQ